jgi:hypothetical protein|tara:strand:+ start:1040 stop:1282 length:243 start_codon:yes stop_codon:yes gene_type:complete
MINVSIHGVADTSITNSEAKELIPGVMGWASSTMEISSRDGGVAGLYFKEADIDSLGDMIVQLGDIRAFLIKTKFNKTER